MEKKIKSCVNLKNGHTDKVKYKSVKYVLISESSLSVMRLNNPIQISLRHFTQSKLARTLYVSDIWDGVSSQRRQK